MPSLIALCGYAGTGKTELLGALGALGEQVLDLEALACHRGSAFGGLGQAPQPSHRRFQALVDEALAAADRARPLWVEDEGPFIGGVGVPDALQEALREAPVVRLEASFDRRVDRLTAEYRGHDRSDLARAVQRSSRRLGAVATARAVAAIEQGRIRDAVAVVLPYYDAGYRHRARGDGRPLLAVVSSEDRDPLGRARRLIQGFIYTPPVCYGRLT
jgi:tRNA 2-selenouridine synthase